MGMMSMKRFRNYISTLHEFITNIEDVKNHINIYLYRKHLVNKSLPSLENYWPPKFTIKSLRGGKLFK